MVEIVSRSGAIRKALPPIRDILKWELQSKIQRSVIQRQKLSVLP